MATSTKKLQLVIDAENKTNKAFTEVNSKLDKVKGKLATMQPAFKKMAVAGGIAFGAISAGVGLAITGASNLEESINAVEVVFGKASEGILKLSEDAATAVGLSKTEFNELSVQFSNFAQIAAGEGGDVVETMAELTGRASDFASVMNIDVAQAATLFQSGLAGQTEPLRRYGIDLSAAAVKHHALASGIIDVDREMSETEKVQARYSLLMEATEKTAGDFANTSDSLANRQRILKSQVTNLTATLGNSFIPIIEKILDKVAPLVEKLATWIEQNPTLARNIIIVVAIITGLVAVLGLLGLILPIIITGFGLLFSPITLIVLAIAGAITITLLLIKHWDFLKSKVAEVWDSVSAKTQEVWSGIKDYFKDLWQGIKDIFDEAINWLLNKIQPFLDVVNKVKGAASSVSSYVSDKASSAYSGAKSLIGLATGGIVRKPTIAMIGEDGPEAVIPLSRGLAGVGGGGNITINITGNEFVGEEGIADRIGNEIMRAIKDTVKL